MADDTASKFGEQMKAAADRMQQSTETLSTSSVEMGMRLLDQAETNTHRAFATMRAIAQAKDVSEVMKIQSDYFREQGTRVVEQAREIGELMTGLGREMAGTITRRG